MANLTKAQARKRAAFYTRQLKALHKWASRHPSRKAAPCFALAFGDKEVDSFRLYAIAPSTEAICAAARSPECAGAYGISVYCADGSSGFLSFVSAGYESTGPGRGHQASEILKSLEPLRNLQ